MVGIIFCPYFLYISAFLYISSSFLFHLYRTCLKSLDLSELHLFFTVIVAQ